jgi:hypothetical protein
VVAPPVRIAYAPASLTDRQEGRENIPPSVVVEFHQRRQRRDDALLTLRANEFVKET